MSRIVHCKHCLNPVFEEAPRCPHCGVGRAPATRPRLLTRRHWMFILVALVIFSAGDSLYWLKKKKAAELDEIRRTEGESFLQALFLGSPVSGRLLLNDSSVRKAFANFSNDKKVQRVMPADDVLVTSLYKTRSIRRWIWDKHRWVGHVLTCYDYEFDLFLSKQQQSFEVRGSLELTDQNGSTKVRGIHVSFITATQAPWLRAR